MSDVFNLNDGPLDGTEDRPGYRHRRTQVGAALGAELLGATVYETPPGEKLWPYHWELGCEEFLVVVSGAPTLRTPEGEQALAPGDLVYWTPSGRTPAMFPDCGWPPSPNVPHPATYQDFSIEFDRSDIGGMEYRIYWRGGTDVWADRITVPLDFNPVGSSCSA